MKDLAWISKTNPIKPVYEQQERKTAWGVDLLAPGLQPLTNKNNVKTSWESREAFILLQWID